MNLVLFFLTMTHAAIYQSHLNYNQILLESGFNCDITFKNVDDFRRRILKLKNENCFSFIHLKCRFDDVTPRPPLEIVKYTKMFLK